jgi:hypothetical protein
MPNAVQLVPFSVINAEVICESLFSLPLPFIESCRWQLICRRVQDLHMNHRAPCPCPEDCRKEVYDQSLLPIQSSRQVVGCQHFYKRRPRRVSV